MKEGELADIASNPARMRILEVIMSKGAASFTDIKRETALSTGSIYYHISLLNDYLDQDRDRRYVLNERGRRLVARIVGDKFPSVTRSVSMMERVIEIVTLADIFKRVVLRPKYSIATFIVSLIIGVLSQLTSNANQILLALPRVVFLDPRLSIIVTGWLLTFALAEVFSIATTGVKLGGEVELAANVALSMVPIYLYSFIIQLSGDAYSMIIVPLQLWSGILLAAGINISKGVKFSHSLIFSLFTGYLSIYIWLSV